MMTEPAGKSTLDNPLICDAFVTSREIDCHPSQRVEEGKC